MRWTSGFFTTEQDLESLNDVTAARYGLRPSELDAFMKLR